MNIYTISVLSRISQHVYFTLLTILTASPVFAFNPADNMLVPADVDSSSTITVAIIGLLLLLVLGLVLWNRNLAAKIKRFHQTENEIARLNGMLDNVLDIVPMSVFWIDVEGRYLGCNQIFAAMVGLHRPQEIVGKSNEQLLTRLNWEKFESICNDVILEGKTLCFDNEMISFSDQKSILAKINVIPMQSLNSETFGALVTIEDISAFRDSEERAEAIFRSSPDCLITIDHDGLIISFNPAAEKVFGYLQSEVKNKPVDAVVLSQEHREMFYKTVAQYQELGYDEIICKHVEIEAIRKRGDRFPAELTVVPLKYGRHHYFLASLRDIGERKIRELEIEHDRQNKGTLLIEMERMRQAIDEHNSIVMTDRGGFITYINEKFSEVSGYDHFEIIGQHTRLFKSGTHEPGFYRNMWQTIVAGQIWNGVLGNRAKNGQLYWCDTTIVPIFGQDKQISGFISIRTDITELRNLESALRLSVERERAIGFEIQQSLLYSPASEVDGARISVFTQASAGVDGDFYDTYMIAANVFDIAVGDVMGKGTAAALVAAATKQNVARFLAESARKNTLPSVANMVNNLNEKMGIRLISLERFLTLIYCRVDTNLMRMTFVDAGHGLMLHASNAGVNSIAGNNLPVGVVETEIYHEESISIADGDLILLFSDGLTETKNQHNEFFGDKWLREILMLCYAQNIPACIVANLIELEVTAFDVAPLPGDDRTILAVRIQKERAGYFEFDFKWSPLEIRRLREVVTHVGRQSGMSVTKLDGLVLAVVESFTNILRHAKNSSQTPSLSFSMEILEHGVDAKFTYVGGAFSDEKKVPDFTGASQGGYGLYIIRNSVDEVRYTTPIANVCSIHIRQRFHHQEDNRNES